MERKGKHFFEAVKRDVVKRIYEEDRELFTAVFSRKNIIKELDEQGVFTLSYRLIDTGMPMYVNMKIVRMHPDDNHIIIGISMIDAQMKQLKGRKKVIEKVRDPKKGDTGRMKG